MTFRVTMTKALWVMAAVGIVSRLHASWQVISPSGMVEADVVLHEDGSLSYEVTLAGKVLVHPSPLGLELQDQTLSTGLTLKKAGKVKKVSDRYTLTTGKQLACEDICNERVLTFRSAEGARLDLVVRAYDDAVAYNYRVNVKTKGRVTLISERSGFALSKDAKAWMQPYDKVTKYAPGYETYYANGIAAGTSCPKGTNGWAFPCLFETDAGWALITEASMTKGYCAMHLENEADSATYTLRLPEKEEALETCEAEPVLPSTFETPWRVILLGDSLGAIVESTVVTSLNPKPKHRDFDWVLPGRSSWSWCYENDSPQNYEAMLPFIDLSAQMGWEYFLVDANWDRMKGGDLEQLVDYANGKGVGVWVWYNSGGPHNAVTEQPRDIMNHAATRAAAFKWLQAIGVKGVKVDFFQSDKPMIIQAYFDILAAAADHEILVNFHGCTLPRGWRRSWPNLMSMEAVKGAESYLFDKDYPGKAPWHNTILPFTRNAVGPMDYTPVTFSDNTLPHRTTYAHELALSIVFESGISHFADQVSGYTTLPGMVQEFLMQVPVTWDETRFIDGYPGSFVVLARRKGDKWYLAGINSSDRFRTLDIDLPRDLNTESAFRLFLDGENDKDFKILGNVRVNHGKLTVQMRASGGFVVEL